jgi:hypothetical protein
VKTTLMTSRVAALMHVQGADRLGMPAVLAPTATAVRERSTAPAVLLPHGTGLPVAGNGTAAADVSPFAPALPGPPRGAPV